MNEKELKLTKEILETVEPKKCSCKGQCQWHAGMSQRVMNIIKRYIES